MKYIVTHACEGGYSIFDSLKEAKIDVAEYDDPEGCTVFAVTKIYDVESTGISFKEQKV